MTKCFFSEAKMKFCFLVVFLSVVPCYADDAFEIHTVCGNNILTLLSFSSSNSQELLTIIPDKQSAYATELRHIGEKGGWEEYACLIVDDVPYLYFRGHNYFEYLSDRVGRLELGHIGFQLNELNGKPLQSHRHQKQLQYFFELLDKTKINNDNMLTILEISNQSKLRKLASKKYPYIESIYKTADFKAFNFGLE